MRPMPKERKILLYILAITIILMLVGNITYIAFERITTAQERLVKVKKQYSHYLAVQSANESMASADIEQLEKTAQTEKLHYYAKGELDIYQFGTLVQNQLAKYGIVVKQFSTTTTAGTTYLQYTTTGTPLAIVSFLKETSEAPKYWSLPYMAMRATDKDRTISFEFKIGYLTYEDK
jgi:hypothetical protein